MGCIIKELNGLWNFTTDPEKIGEQNEWYINGFEGESVKVPGAWQTYNKEMVTYTGYAWYSREFNINEAIHEFKRFFLKFEAVDYVSDVWINGKYLGSHEGGYTPFDFEVTEHLKEGDNLIVVRVFDPDDNDEIPHGKQGSWYTRVSGIWQDVLLVGYDKTFIENVLITPDIDNKRAITQVKIKDRDRLVNPRIEFKIDPRVNGNKVEGSKTHTYKYFLDEQELYELEILDLYLWGPESPALYDMTVILKDGNSIIDSYQTYFGMRKIEYKNGMVYLNHKPLYIRGALDQAFWPKTIYRPESEELIKEEILKAKEMGFNLLRKHIKTEDPRYLYWADYLGMLIWEEPANYASWTPQARKRFKKEFTRMVKRDYNHPSIIAWSIYNEEWGLEWKLKENKDMQKWVEGFYEYARELDPTRLICDNSGWAHVKTDINDYHRYFAVPENHKEWQEDLDNYIIKKPGANYVDGYKYNGEPLIVSEFGMWGLPEISKIEEAYEELPEWYRGNSKLFSEDFKIPATLKENYKKYNLNKIFKSYDELCYLTQERQFRGVKSIIEEMRKRSEIAGYVVTELTDIEWETNGFLDYFRNPKFRNNCINHFNGQVILAININKHNFWSGEECSFTPIVINNSDKKIQGVFRWYLEESELKGIFPVKIPAYSNQRLDEIKFNFPGDWTGSRGVKLRVELEEEKEVVTSNYEELTVTNRREIKKTGKSLQVKGLSHEFKNKLKNNGFELKTNNSLVLTDNLTEEVLKEVRNGTRVVFLAENGNRIQDKGYINFTKLPGGESWDRAATFNFINTDIFDGIPLLKISGWELEDIYPDYKVKNLVDLNCTEIISGNFAGWLGDFGATTFVMNWGRGQVLVTTLKLISNYHTHPIASLLLNKLINYFQEHK
ncbi:glycoside hydrolase family 2 protein [Halothermothrix orenii]|uniref:Glycoside hydrolase family 2 sugar binding n=1 Tax=Halothermothrix orenii (strain H 168 / OCM 544 / DSM 9562) TaxID=373903 RepID=B8CZV2_HALOH|nr:glycoside hydrolase family 2 [Halothermothrix orenii]ACL70804.1 glycoside hydrolase family 2 sugar binding [Halothermothrix orenii H 168]